ncbi:hypothetical protein TSOC_014547, partial [Tetrabaena socialis]
VYEMSADVCMAAGAWSEYLKSVGALTAELYPARRQQQERKQQEQQGQQQQQRQQEQQGGQGNGAEKDEECGVAGGSAGGAGDDVGGPLEAGPQPVPAPALPGTIGPGGGVGCSDSRHPNGSPQTDGGGGGDTSEGDGGGGAAAGGPGQGPGAEEAGASCGGREAEEAGGSGGGREAEMAAAHCLFFGCVPAAGRRADVVPLLRGAHMRPFLATRHVRFAVQETENGGGAGGQAEGQGRAIRYFSLAPEAGFGSKA